MNETIVIVTQVYANDYESNDDNKYVNDNDNLYNTNEILYTNNIIK